MKNWKSPLFVVGILLASPALSGSYRVSKIDDVVKAPEDKARAIAMCRDYTANLNTFDQSKPMICERKLSPMFPQFRRPSWRTWDNEEIWNRRSLLIKSYQYDSPPNQNISDAKWDAHFRQLIAEATTTVHEANDVPMGEDTSRWIKIQTKWPKDAKPDRRWPWKWEWQGCTAGNLIQLTADGSDRMPGIGNLPGAWDFLIHRDVTGKERTVDEYWFDSWREAKQTLWLVDTCKIEYRQPRKGAKK